jgi:serine/threonine protein kinase
MKCESLGNILLHEEYRFLMESDLSNRLKLARALAWTIFELHSVGWVHKSFHPNNILLFGEQNASQEVEFDWSSPYVVGFDSSRANTGVSGKLDFRAQWANRVYTHPDHQVNEYTRYQKFHDLYSLGVVLLEIGMLQSFLGNRDNEWTRAAPEKLKELFVEKAQVLKPVLGKIYADADKREDTRTVEDDIAKLATGIDELETVEEFPPFLDYASYTDPVVDACFMIDFPKAIGNVIETSHSKLDQHVSTLQGTCYFAGGYDIVPHGGNLRYPEHLYCFQGRSHLRVLTPHRKKRNAMDQLRA